LRPPRLPRAVASLFYCRPGVHRECQLGTPAREAAGGLSRLPPGVLPSPRVGRACPMSLRPPREPGPPW
jgi:hypothetical protein